mmetsp:Transcript_11501/g.17124  ORF Transcript_11501/g.17124 Transcript_11501/m.17124 type:complete len:89 (-) Transcript_11501:47-313(-)
MAGIYGSYPILLEAWVYQGTLNWKKLMKSGFPRKMKYQNANIIRLKNQILSNGGIVKSKVCEMRGAEIKNQKMHDKFLYQIGKKFVWN